MSEANARQIAIDDLIEDFQRACEETLVCGEAERPGATKHRALLRNELRKQLLDASALTARAVRAECDTKRLDWLETSGLELLRIAREPDYTQEDFVIHDPNSAAENSAIAVCDSLREAIDKASAPRPATP